MPQVLPARMTVEIEGDFVVFLIGMRINKLWKIHKWLPVFLAMPPILKELDAHPESGCLGTIRSLGVIVQYWRSFDHLEAYARNSDQKHWPAWVAFNKRTGGSRGDVGIWHETYHVRAGEYEAVYSGMRPTDSERPGNWCPSAAHETRHGDASLVRDRAGREPHA